MMLAYKVLTAGQWADLQKGVFEGAAVDVADGYVHLSTAAQLGETLAKHFAGQQDLVVAAVDLDRLGDAVKWEVSRGGALFPHLYGRLTMAAVVGWEALG
ncbi:MAG: hypothetical protein B7Z75_12070 [Acidocella sp. 20-57-95]|nr:MAG: hypothetical protein B7Z75_12070 [Acidocella sp. 20-57-95]